MIKKIYPLILLIIMSVAFASELKEAVETTPVVIGADAMGRGGTYLGEISGNNCVFQNYAQTTTITRPKMSVMSTNLMGEFSYTAFSLALPKWSFGYYGVTSFGGYERDANNIVGDKLTYADSNLYAAYSFTYDQLLLGVRGKYIQKSVSTVKDSASGFALDLISHYQVNQYLGVGAEITNIGFGGLSWTTGQFERFPQTLGIGLETPLFGESGLWTVVPVTTNIYFDTRLSSRGTILQLGTEVRPIKYLTFRAGLGEYYSLRDDETSGKDVALSLGLGLHLFDLDFDYAYRPLGGLDVLTTHFFMLSYTLPYIFVAVPSDNSAVTTAETVTLDSQALIATADPMASLNVQTKPDLEVTQWVVFSDLDSQKNKDLLEELATLGLINGYKDGTFQPNAYITRRELSILVARLLKKQGIVISADQGNKIFTDLDYNLDKFGSELREAVEAQVLRGYPNGQARVLNYATRAEGVCLFERYNRLADEPTINYAEQFADVKETHWGAQTIVDARGQGLVQGIGNNLYSPAKLLRRIDAALMLSRTAYVVQLRETYREELAALKSGRQ